MPLSNALLARWSGGWLWVEDAASIAEHGRREAFLSLGQVASEGEATRLAQAALATSAQPQVSVQTAIEPAGGDVPYDDFNVGDTVTVPDQRGRPAQRRVLALTVTEDEEGNPVYVPELATIVEAEGRRQRRALKRMANGTLGGTSASASPLRRTAAAAAAAVRPASRPETFVWSYPADAYDPFNLNTGRYARWSGTVVEARLEVSGPGQNLYPFTVTFIFGFVSVSLQLVTNEVEKVVRLSEPIAAGTRIYPYIDSSPAPAGWWVDLTIFKS